MLLKPMGRGAGAGERSAQKITSKRQGPWLGAGEKPKLKRPRLLIPVETDSSNIKLLEAHVSAFLRDLQTTIRDCYGKPRRSANLKFLVSQALLCFHMTYLNIKPHLGEFDVKDSVYLGLMSELVAIYVDLELKASRRGGNSFNATSRTLYTALYVYLDNSENHMAEAILKSRLMTKANEEICAPVLAKFLTKAKCEIDDEGDYARFLLSFKLWKRLKRRPEERREIGRMATSKLEPPTPVAAAVRRLRRIFPGVPKIEPHLNVTFVLINSQFDFFKSKVEFLKTYSLTQNSMYKSLSDRRPFFFSDLRFCFPGPKKKNLACGGLKFIKQAPGTVGEAEKYTDDSRVEGEEQSLEVFTVDSDEGKTEESGRKGKRADPESPEAWKNTTEVPKVCFVQNVEEGVERAKTMNFESLAKCYKIVKSSALKPRETVSTQTGGDAPILKHFNFSSKIVKISQEEWNGTKPKRIKSWRAILKERRLLEEERKKWEEATVPPGTREPPALPRSEPETAKEDAVLSSDSKTGGFPADEDFPSFLNSLEGNEENCLGWPLLGDQYPGGDFGRLNDDSILEFAFPDDLFSEYDSGPHLNCSPPFAPESKGELRGEERPTTEDGRRPKEVQLPWQVSPFTSDLLENNTKTEIYHNTRSLSQEGIPLEFSLPTFEP